MAGLSANVDVANNTTFTIPWNLTRYSSGTAISYDNVTNRFTIPHTGLWSIGFQLGWTAITSNWNRILMIILTSLGSFRVDYTKPVGWQGTAQQNIILPMTQNDWLSAQTLQNQGNIQPIDASPTFLTLTYSG